ncbi:MAG: glycosyltransferase family 4 protein [Phycisphaerae bacterium]|nr:glycosyltransferase family 4 protein [Phycisphaerae bacterium]
MKILMLNYEFPPIGGGGGQAHRNILLQYAKVNDLEVDVLTCGMSGVLEKEKFADNINIYRVGIRKENLHHWKKFEVVSWLMRAKKYYYKLINENNYDLIHSFFAFPSGFLCYKKNKGVPYIISLRGSDVPGTNVRLGLEYILLSSLFKKIWNNAAVIVANSSGQAELASKFVPEFAIPVIPNGIDLERFIPSQFNVIGKQVRLLTVSRLTPGKRIDILIRAVKICNDNGIDAVLNIAGHGHLMEQLRQFSVDLNVADKVNFLGRVESVAIPELYRENNIFIMSSAHEGMSNAMLEAMASGLPIVTTDCEGVQELIADNGIVSPDDSSEEFVSCIEELVNNKNLFDDMKVQAREQAEKFKWETTAGKYLEIYKNIVAK